MASTTTGTTSFDKTVQELIQRRLYSELRAGLPHLPRGAVLPASFHGKNSGGNGVFRFVRVADLDATPANHVLSEGIPPAGQELDLGYEEFTAGQKGDFVAITDAADFLNPHDLAKVAADRVVRQMKTVTDRIARAAILASTNVIFCGTGNTDTDEVAAGDVLLSSDIKKGTALLEGASVERIEGGYVGIIHPYVKFDLELDDDTGGWIDANRYAGSGNLFTGEVGTYAGVRFISTAEAAVKADSGTASIDVYSTTLMGKESVAVGDLSTQETITEKGGVSDPLHQLLTVGWKMWLGACAVGDATSAADAPEPRLIRIESASSL